MPINLWISHAGEWGEWGAEAKETYGNGELEEESGRREEEEEVGRGVARMSRKEGSRGCGEEQHEVLSTRS